TQGVFPSQDTAPDSKTPMLGEVMAFAGSAIPHGWAAANGQILQVNTNEALFSTIGTFYGGNGTSNFALPDLRGRSVAGVGMDANGQTVTLGEKYGTPDITLSLGNLPLPTSATSTLAVAHVAPSISDAGGPSTYPV